MSGDASINEKLYNISDRPIERLIIGGGFERLDFIARSATLCGRENFKKVMERKAAEKQRYARPMHGCCLT